MGTGDVCASKHSCVRLVNSRLEPFRYEVDLVVYLSVCLEHVRSLFLTVCVDTACWSECVGGFWPTVLDQSV
jgi:hypothetical protein